MAEKEKKPKVRERSAGKLKEGSGHKAKNIEIAIDEIVFHDNNARTHSKAQIIKLKNSISKFGFTNPILLWKGNVLIGGEGRITAAKELIKDNPTRYAHLKMVPARDCSYLSDTERRALALADNRLALDAGWNENILQEELARLSEEDFDLAFTGFDEDEIDLGDAEDPNPPEEFKDFGEIVVHYKCPSCDYAWSGKPKSKDDGNED